MDTVRIKNLRSLVDTGEINLCPITLLVGKNSSGKSTFLRTFPLLRQSVETRIKGPLLWSGPYVDFGDFSDAIYLSDQDNQVEIEFNFVISIDKAAGYLPYYYFRQLIGPLLRERSKDNLPLNIPISVILKIGYDKKSGDAYSSEYSVRIFDNCIDVQASCDGTISKFIVNSSDVTSLFKNYKISNLSGIIPNLIRVQSNNSEIKEVDVEEEPTILEKKIKGLIKRRTSKQLVNSIVSCFNIADKQNILNRIKINSQYFDYWNNIVSGWDINNQDFNDLVDTWIAINWQKVMLLAREYVNSYVINSKYIAPVRATAERYYRIQNLAVDEPDFQGRNLPMYLRNLNEVDRTSFSNWTSNLFGFSIFTDSSFGHISIFIKDLVTGNKFNLTDTGFGYSQILPILVQLWNMVGRKKGAMGRSRIFTPTLIAIEQPELHLHPGLQAKLADAFVSVINDAKSEGTTTSLIIETHSPTIINRIGHLISQQKISQDEVNVVVFEKEIDSLQTNITISNFDQEGFLNNWPYGFFEPDEVI